MSADTTQQRCEVQRAISVAGFPIIPLLFPPPFPLLNFQLDEGASNLFTELDPASTVRERSTERTEAKKGRNQCPDAAWENARESEIFNTKPQATLPALGRSRDAARSPPPAAAVVFTTGSGQLKTPHVSCSGSDVEKTATPSILGEPSCNGVNGDSGTTVENSPAVMPVVDGLERDRSVVLFGESSTDGKEGRSGCEEGDQLECPPKSAADFRSSPSVIDGDTEPVPRCLGLVGDGFDPAADNWNLMGNELIDDDCSRLCGNDNESSIDECNSQGKGLENRRSSLDRSGAVSKSTCDGLKNDESSLLLKGKGGGGGSSGASSNALGAERSLQDSSNRSKLKGKRPRSGGVDGVATLRDTTNVTVEVGVGVPPYKRRANLEVAL